MTIQENINAVCNNLNEVITIDCKYNMLVVLDQMHSDGILSHEDFFKYRDIINGKIDEIKGKRWLN